MAVEEERGGMEEEAVRGREGAEGVEEGGPEEGIEGRGEGGMAPLLCGGAIGDSSNIKVNTLYFNYFKVLNNE